MGNSACLPPPFYEKILILPSMIFQKAQPYRASNYAPCWTTPQLICPNILTLYEKLLLEKSHPHILGGGTILIIIFTWDHYQKLPHCQGPTLCKKYLNIDANLSYFSTVWSCTVMTIIQWIKITVETTEWNNWVNLISTNFILSNSTEEVLLTE